MTKPRTPRPVTSQKAPKAARPEAPFERIHQNPPRARRQESRDSQAKVHPKVYPGAKASGVKRPAAGPETHRGAPPETRPGARISRRAADRLRAGHLWVYASDIESLELPQPALPEGESPALLPVADQRGLLLGTALYSPTSQIALRLVSREAIDNAGWLELLESRLRASIGRRKPWLDERTDACRLCFSEADELPGLVVDKYGDLVILQLLAKGLDSAAVRERCVRVLREELAPAAILERPDPRVRELEGLAAPNPAPLWTADAAATVRQHGIPAERPQVSLRRQLRAEDRRLSRPARQLRRRRRVGAQAGRGERSGARSTSAATRAALRCTWREVCSAGDGSDASRASLEVAERNLEANRARLTAQVDWVEGDAFEILRDWSDAGEKIRRHRARSAGLRQEPARRRRRAARLQGAESARAQDAASGRPAGHLLLLASCGLGGAGGRVASAAVDAHRRVRLLERRGAALDHPGGAESAGDRVPEVPGAASGVEQVSKLAA